MQCDWLFSCSSLSHSRLFFSVAFPTPSLHSFLCSFPAENLGEVAPLEACIPDKNAIWIHRGGWKWSEAEPWPPVENVLRSEFWSNDAYATVRDRLLRPAPVPTVTVGGEFITVDSVAQVKAKTAKKGKSGEPAEEGDSAATQPPASQPRMRGGMPEVCLNNGFSGMVAGWLFR